MSASGIVIAVLSGGFVGVVYKSSQGRAAWFRSQMIESSEEFVAAAFEAQDALERLLRALQRWSKAEERVGASMDGLRALYGEEQAPESVLTMLDVSHQTLTRVHTYLFADQPDAHDRTDSALAEAARRLEALSPEEVGADGVSHLHEWLDLLTRWVSWAGVVRAEVARSNEAASETERARSRVTLLFAGRRRSAEVLLAADAVLAALRRVDGVCRKAMDGPLSEEDETQRAGALRDLGTARDRFATAANSAARRSLL